MASLEDVVAKRNKLQREILALESTLGNNDNIIELISSDSDSAEESDDSGHAEEEVVHKNLEAERQQIQREIKELEEKLGADAALVDALSDSEHGSGSPVNSSDDDDDELELPQDLDTCLQINLVYQEILKEKLAELERLLNENQQEQKELKAQISGPASNSPGLPHLKLFLGSFMKPYFKDKVTGLGPPSNEETKEKMSHGTQPSEGMKIRRWEPWQKTLLTNSVVRDTLKRMLQPKMSKKDYLISKMAKVQHEEKEALKQHIAILDKEMAEISSMKDEELYGHRHDDHDWDKISNIDFEGLRQPDDLMRFWQNYLHPSINKSPWKQDEIDKLADIVEQYNCSHWDLIAEALGTNRTAFMCFQTYQRYISKTFKKREWTKEEDKVLKHLVEKMRIGNFIPYTQMSYFMEGRDYCQLIYRWTTVLDPSIKKGPWTKEEDQLLLDAVKKNGRKEWWKIKNDVPGRTDGACRDRYLDSLCEDVKRGAWSTEEVELLKQMVAKHGVGKWAKIASEIPNRVDCQCLNKWKSMTQPDTRKRKRRRTTKPNCERQSKRRKLVNEKIIKEEETESDSGSDDEEAQGVTYMDDDNEQEEAEQPSFEDLCLKQEYVQPDTKDWIPVPPKTPVHSDSNVRYMLVSLANKEKDDNEKERTESRTALCWNTVLDRLGNPVKSYLGTDLPALQKWNISDEQAMIKVPAKDIKSFLLWKRNSFIKKKKHKIQAASKLNCSLMLAIAPWVGNVIMHVPAKELTVCEADMVRKRAADVPLVKTPVFLLFLLALRIDAEGCKKVITARKCKVSLNPRADQSLRQDTQRAPGSNRRNKMLATKLSEQGRNKESPLQMLESVNLLPGSQPTEIPLPSISQQQSNSSGQMMKPKLILPKNVVSAQPNMLGLRHLNLVVQKTTQVPQSLSQFVVPVGSGKLAQQSATTSSLLTSSSSTESSNETGTPKRNRRPTMKAKALIESAQGKASKKQKADNNKNAPDVTANQLPLNISWILTSAGLMPVAAIQVTCPPTQLSLSQNPTSSIVPKGHNDSSLSNSKAPSAGTSVPSVPTAHPNPHVPASLTESLVQTTPPNTACNQMKTINSVSHMAFQPPVIVNNNGSFALLCNSVNPLIPSTASVVNAMATNSPAPSSNSSGVQSQPVASITEDSPKDISVSPQCSVKNTPHVTSHSALQANGISTPSVQLGIMTPSFLIAPSVVVQQMIPQAQTQTIQGVVTTAVPSPNPDALSFDVNLVFLENSDQVKNWMKGSGGTSLPHQQNKMPYLPPFVSNIDMLVALLKAKESLLNAAEKILPDEDRNNEEEEARITAIRKQVSQKFQNNPAYLNLKARFLSCFTLPALLATIHPCKETTHDTFQDEENDEGTDKQKQGADDRPQTAGLLLNSDENNASAAQFSGLRSKRKSHVPEGSTATS